jgi:hypothetical protein
MNVKAPISKISTCVDFTFRHLNLGFELTFGF